MILFCRHPVLRVARKHASTVTPREKAKLLYVDRLGVWNFIACARCGKVFETEQHDLLFDTMKEET